MATVIGIILGCIAGLAAGFYIGFLVRQRQATARIGSAEQRAETLIADAERNAEAKRREMLVDAQDEVLRLRRQAEEELGARRADADRRESRIQQKEEQLDQRDRQLVERESELQREMRGLDQRDTELNDERARLQSERDEIDRQLQRVAGMSVSDAKAALTRRIEEDAKREAMALVRNFEQKAREEAEQRARRIVTLAIQRVASEQTTESSVAVVTIPNEDMKGRIIGREGRNIRAFEAVTGVNIIIDDTPEAVLLSCFDPVRREIGRLTLEKLVGDGRIHPARIEEMVDRAKGEVEEQIRRAGEEAVLDVGITDINPELVRVLGRLQYRTSYGQNVLKHLVESAHLSGILGAELGMNHDEIRLLKRCGLLHDVGKAVTHEVEGSHAIIGAELARRLDEPADVVHAIESHHGEVEQRTLYAVLSQTADQISGGRPGARRETLEAYVKRLEKLEEIATSYAGVEKTFAMQAGREVRVIVKPGDVDDVQCQVLARDIAKRIEEELQYPGQIKVNVIREIRASEYAK
ncbi:MAG TPA: ribonuclease Y [Actinomycetota bacterium]|nr:ribonuclease Y [Actinomycetota bacterium]